MKKRIPRPAGGRHVVTGLGWLSVASLISCGCGATARTPPPASEQPAALGAVGEAHEPAELEEVEEIATPEPEQDYPFPYEMIEGEPMFTVVPKDGIPAIDEPAFVSAEEAQAFMDPEETVLGVVGRDGTAKCYSAWQLDGHEIVNDELDGEPIAATW